MKLALKIIRITVNIILVAVFALLVLYNGYVLINRYVFKNGMPKFFGFSFAIVATGSMEPEISIGDFIVNKDQDTYALGDVITFYDSQRQEYVTHRIILVENENYLTKGDANNGADRFTVPKSAVVGKVVGKIPKVGNMVSFFQTPFGLFVLIAVGILIYTISSIFSRKNNEESENLSETKN